MELGTFSLFVFAGEFVWEVLGPCRRPVSGTGAAPAPLRQISASLNPTLGHQARASQIESSGTQCTLFALP